MAKCTPSEFNGEFKPVRLEIELETVMELRALYAAMNIGSEKLWQAIKQLGPTLNATAKDWDAVSYQINNAIKYHVWGTYGQGGS